jgi:hypothetical protein
MYCDLVEQYATDDISAAKNSMVELSTDADTINQSITLKHTTIKLPYLNFTEIVTKILTIIHDPYSIEHQQLRENDTQLLSDKNVFQWANVLNVMRVKVSHDMSNCIQKSVANRMNKYMATVVAFFTTYTQPSTDLFSSIWNAKEVILYQQIGQLQGTQLLTKSQHAMMDTFQHLTQLQLAPETFAETVDSDGINLLLHSALLLLPVGQPSSTTRYAGRQTFSSAMSTVDSANKHELNMVGQRCVWYGDDCYKNYNDSDSESESGSDDERDFSFFNPSTVSKVTCPNDTFFNVISTVSTQRIIQCKYNGLALIRVETGTKAWEFDCPITISMCDGEQEWAVQMAHSTWSQISMYPLIIDEKNTLHIDYDGVGLCANGQMLLSALLCYQSDDSVNISKREQKDAFNTLMNEVLHLNISKSIRITQLQRLLQCVIITYTLELRNMDRILDVLRKSLKKLVIDLPGSGCPLVLNSCVSIYPRSRLYVAREQTFVDSPIQRNIVRMLLALRFELEFICYTPKLHDKIFGDMHIETSDKLKRALQWVKFINYNELMLAWMRNRNDAPPSVDDLLEGDIDQMTALQMLSPYLPGYPTSPVESK